MWSFTSRVREKGLLVGTFVTLDSIHSFQIIGNAGYDCIILDMEHTPMSAREMTTAVGTIAAASKGSCAPLVRVPSHGLEWVKWALDSGAAGVVVPMVETADQARAVVKNSRYPPDGARSFGPLHAAFAHPGSDRSMLTYFDAAKKPENIAILPMIESARGVENADSILAEEGVSGAFVGPYDLRVSLGLQGGDGAEDVFIQALQAIVAAGRRAGKPVGIYTGTTQALKRNIQLGFQFFLYHGDSTLLATASQNSVQEARSVFQQAKL